MTDEFYWEMVECGCIKFGEFRLRSGILSPFYVDLRGIVSRPSTLLKEIGRAMAEKAMEIGPHKVPSGVAFSELMPRVPAFRLAALPYAGLPIGVAAAIAGGIPLIYTRKEIKEHGTARQIEGEYHAGERAIVVDDVITDGGTKLDSIKPLEEAGLVVKDVIIVLDREQGGGRVLAQHGYTLHSIMSLTPTLETLVRLGLITTEQQQSALDFVAEHQFG